MNWVIRLASPKPVMHPITQASWACSGTWDWTNSVHRSGSRPSAEQLGRADPGALAQQGRVVAGGDRVQVDHAVEGVVGVLQRHPVAQRTQIVAEVERVGGRLDAGEHAGAIGHARHSRREHRSAPVASPGTRSTAAGAASAASSAAVIVTRATRRPSISDTVRHRSVGRSMAPGPGPPTWGSRPNAAMT